MSGVYSGVQARIKQLSPLAEYVPCSAHSLNLIGSCAAESCTQTVSFFGLLQEIFNFFSNSTHRWALLQEKCKNKIQNLSKTRWSARHDACRVVSDNFQGIVDSLDEIANSISEKPATRNGARALKEKMSSLETTFMSIMWSKILERFDKVNHKLQYETMEISKVINYYESLCDYIQELRNNFHELENLAKSKCEREYSADSRRKRKIPTQFVEYGESNSAVTFTGSENFRVSTFNVILDTLLSELKRRVDKYSDFHNMVGFFEILRTLEPSEISKKASAFYKKYSGDIEPTFVEECVHLKPFLVQNTKTEELMTLTNINKLLRQFDAVDIYPNIAVALRMVLSTPVTNCTGERSFSTLRRIKNYLRSTTTNERLSSLALLSIESNLTQEISYDDLIDNFARKKSRRKSL
ncbi:hypothetical protein WDU94_012375 [Cyamophila willieti]